MVQLPVYLPYTTLLFNDSKMTLGILEPKAETQPPGTYFLVDTSQTSAEHNYEHSHFKHSKGKVGYILLPAASVHTYMK